MSVVKILENSTEPSLWSWHSPTQKRKKTEKMKAKMRARGSPAKELFVSSVALSSVALDQEMPHQICFGLWRQISRGNFGSSFGFCFSLCEAGSVDRLSVGASSCEARAKCANGARQKTAKSEKKEKKGKRKKQEP